VLRGRKAYLIKIIFCDGTGLCLFTNRLEQDVFLWPSNVERHLGLAFRELVFEP
jgi:transposase